ncbi:hypothetical protein [Rhizobium sp. SG_E_25_P2]|uniref:hypothetical protein n=1 Tax=Rhizobium sp. SG_E_25_P2 TaxID=2879942 RepID=UPI0024766853|nr:hypothetical protein [Rhizobium sp. SG_E_25_P2]
MSNKVVPRVHCDKSEGAQTRMVEMLVLADDDGGARRQRAFDVKIILGVIEKRTKPEPRAGEGRASKNRIENDVDVLSADPRILPKQTRALEDIFIVKRKRDDPALPAPPAAKPPDGVRRL